MAGRGKALVVGGLLAYAGVSYAVYAKLKPKGHPPAVTPSTDSSALWNGVAPAYDAEIDFDETLTGIKLFRRVLLWSATGKVLEVSAGTGRNTSYYRPGAECVIITDRSPAMVALAAQKAAAALDPAEQIKFQFKTADVRIFFGVTEFQCFVVDMAARQRHFESECVRFWTSVSE